jgi:hypothetical protein
MMSQLAANLPYASLLLDELSIDKRDSNDFFQDLGFLEGDFS